MRRSLRIKRCAKIIADRGGCVNTLAPTRWQTDKTSASAPNSCLIEVERWTPERAVRPPAGAEARR